MPDPISSSNSAQPSSIGSDPTLDETGQVCRSDAPNGSLPEPAVSTPPAVNKLISAVPPPSSALPPASHAPPQSMAQNNAQRTAEHSGIAPYAAVGITGDFHDSAYAGVAALKGHDPKTGLDLELFSASLQVGLENEAQAGLARVGLSGQRGSLAADFFTVRATEGIHNDDGSVGVNVGALATIAGTDGTLRAGAGSFTFGLAAGVGGALSVGVRDIDDNGNPELCVKASIGPVTVGFCSED